MNMAFYYNAIFFDKNSNAFKYRTIKNIEKFEEYITGKFDVLYINYYDKKTKQFLFRKYIKHFGKYANNQFNKSEKQDNSNVEK